MKKKISLQKMILAGVYIVTAIVGFACGWLFTDTAGVSASASMENPEGAAISAVAALVCGVGVYFIRHCRNRSGEKSYE